MTNNYVDQEELGIEDEMPMGKYKGLSIVSILEDDPEYLRWFAGAMETHALSDEIEAALESETDRIELLRDYESL